MMKRQFKTLEGVTTSAGGAVRPLSPRDELYARASTLVFGQVVLYSRKSCEGENAGKSIEDQNTCNLETVRYHEMPADETCVRAEEIGCGGDLWWIGGGGSGIRGDQKTGGKERTRPVLTQIVEEIVAGTVKAVVCYAQDRLWRDVGIADAMIDLFNRYGVLLFDRYGPVDIQTPEGKQTVRQNAVSAQAYKERVAQDVSRGLRMSRQQGQLVTSPDKLGFRSAGKHTKRVLVVTEEIEVVRRIFRLFVYGEDHGPLTPPQIARLLADEGYEWPREIIGTRGRPRNEYTDDLIYQYQITKVLKDCRYQGRQPHAGQEWDCPAFLIEGEPAVDTALYERAQAKIASEKRIGNASNKVRALTGILRCSGCGQGLQISLTTYTNKDGHKHRVGYWENCRHATWAWCTHKLPFIRENILDDYIDTVFAPLLLAEIRDKAVGQSATELASRCADLERQIREKNADWEEEARQLRADGVKARTIALYEQDHEVEVAKLQSRVNDARALMRKATTLEIGLESLERLSPSARRDAIHACLRWAALVPNDGPPERIRAKSNKLLLRSPTLAGKLLFLTTWGTYHTAVVERLYTDVTDHRQLVLRPALPEEMIGGVADLPDPAAFLSGLERAYKGRRLTFNPIENTPGYSRTTSGMPLPIATFDLASEGSSMQIK